MTTLEARATAALAHALYDSESTGRLSEDAGAEAEFFTRAKNLLFMVKHYQTEEARKAIAEFILQGEAK